MITLEELTEAVGAIWPDRYQRGRLLQLRWRGYKLKDGSRVSISVTVQGVTPEEYEHAFVHADASGLAEPEDGV